MLQQCADVHRILVLADITALQQAPLDPADQLDGLVGAVAKHGTAGLAALAGLFQVVERLLIDAHGLALLFEALAVGGEFDLAQHQLHLAIKIGQGLFQLGHSGVIAVALVMLAGDAQFLGVLLDHRNITQLVAAVDDAVQAVPAGQGNGQGQ
ncbi:hypothetical protein D3C80_1302240 [compost metagenome]